MLAALIRKYKFFLQNQEYHIKYYIKPLIHFRLIQAFNLMPISTQHLKLTYFRQILNINYECLLINCGLV